MSAYDHDAAYLALKEWQVAVDALLRGEVGYLARKGGIHEPGNQFLRDAARFWLFPTYEHQFEYVDEGTDTLREPWATRLTESRTQHREADDAERLGIGVHTPAEIPITGYVETVGVHEFWAGESIAALTDMGIWTRAFVEARLRWKPRDPLTVFRLRAFRSAKPLSVPADQVPRKCYSWLELPFALAEHKGDEVTYAGADDLESLCEELLRAPDEEAAQMQRRVQMVSS
ncbi:DUF1802 family protein [Candidatus Poribacteria bacterium]|nr:DUF1802 family protein [Candidatus Poribacteria bacterium]MBT5531695.1 DUF1802 family protein [Candidatus Poribacteria bacterium]MBT5711507.1 DUF1802 family protein [Candidatus Poribacteria bacterium]MBT7804961.1 DUF1802 family protein [Candidatus Poribacteria bacterium]